MKILRKMPIILTKDAEWVSGLEDNLEPGMIFVIPEDAIIVLAPEVQKEGSE